MDDSAAPLLAEYLTIEERLADPSVHSDLSVFRRLTKRYAALSPTVAAYRSWLAASEDHAAARELALEDEGFAAEVRVGGVQHFGFPAAPLGVAQVHAGYIASKER